MTKRLFILASAILFAATASAQQFDDPDNLGLECTSIMVGRQASGTGSVITSHTCDGVSHTWVTIVPAADHKASEMTPIRKNWRRTRFPEDTVGIKTVGYIPQVAHTYKYVNTGYPCMNEKQVGIGETTFSGPDTLINRKSMLLVEELCRLALERCDNARDAIRLMGALAEEYGYGDGGECLTVADKNEVWQFEITGNGKHSTGAIWVAQRIPDGHVGISANITRIGRIDRSDPDNFMASDNVEEVCKAHGLWDGESEFVFWKAVKCDYAKGKNFREREFIVLSELAPSLGLTFDMEEIPFSVKPDSTVSARRVMEILRGTYEGTDFDMCKNWLMDVPEKDGVPAHKEISPVANPWLTNNTRNTLNTIAPGVIEFRRTLAVAWCAYSTVIEFRRDLPDEVGGVCWYAVDNPAQSPHIPIFCGSTVLPDAFNRCGHKQYDPDCVLWQFRRANKLATLSWQTTKKEFNEAVNSFDDFAFGSLESVEKAYMKAGNSRKKTAVLNGCTAQVHSEAVRIWKELEAKYWSMFGRGF
ncbi:MAG: C69 family dipeptidase [Bacteroidales bacterium]|nr:C69 family dipeptidase [Bacteroidales bacterium]